MRFQFKSLIVVSETEQRVMSGTKTTTVYDMKNIGEHTFDVPTWEVRLHPIHLLTTPLFASPFLVLALLLLFGASGSEGWWSYRWLPPLLIGGPLVLFYPLSVTALLNRMMQAQARRERLLAPNVRLTCIKDSEWEWFRAKLKPDLAAEIRGLLDRVNKLKLAEDAPAPPEDAGEKWKPQTNTTEGMTEKPGERATDIQPGDSSKDEPGAYSRAGI
jgi:hypothetical protein